MTPYARGHVKRKRWQPNTEQALAYVKHLESERACYPEDKEGDRAFWRDMLDKFPEANKRKLKEHMANKDKLLEALNTQRQGKQNRYKASRAKEARKKGLNKPGAGRPSLIQSTKDRLKASVKREEDIYGHALSDDDIFLMFREMLAERLLTLLKLQKAERERAARRTGRNNTGGGGLEKGGRRHTQQAGNLPNVREGAPEQKRHTQRHQSHYEKRQKKNDAIGRRGRGQGAPYLAGFRLPIVADIVSVRRRAKKDRHTARCMEG